MKKYCAFVLGCLFLLTGCATCPVAPSLSLPQAALPSDVPYRVTLGMKIAEVRSVIGPKVVIGYEIGANGHAIQPMSEDSLVGTELMTINGQVYQVDEYLVPLDVSSVSGKDRTILVFKDGILVARGEVELKALQQAAGQ